MNRIFYCICFLLSTAIGYAQKYPSYIPYRTANAYGYSDSSGRVLIAAQWIQANFFKDGPAVVEDVFLDRKVYALIDTQGKYIIAPEKQWNGYFGIKNGFNASDMFNTRGYIDVNGKYIIPPKYFSQGGFTYNKPFNTYYLICSDSTHMVGTLDTNGHSIIPFVYTKLIPPAINETALQPYIIAKTEKDCSLLNIKGKILIPPGKYDDMMFIHQRWLKVTKNGLDGLLDFSLNMAIPCKYDLSDFINNDLIRTTAIKNNKFYWGLMDTHGNTILRLKYASINLVNDTTIVASKYKGSKQLYGVVNDRGRKVFPFKYLYIAANLGQTQLEFTKHKLALRAHSNKQSLDSNKYFTTYAYKQTTYLPKPKLQRKRWEYSYPYPSLYRMGPCYISGDYTRNEEHKWQKQFITINDKTDTSFTQKDTTWNTLDDIGDNRILVRAMKQKGHPTGIFLYSVIDKNCAFLTRCIKDTQILHYNPVGKIYYARTPSNFLYTLLDTNLNPMIPMQKTSIYKGFYWQNKLYALVWEQGFGLMNETDYAGFWGYNHHSKYKLLINAAGQTVNIGSYKIITAVSMLGTPSSRSSFEGIFLAADTLGNEGFITFDGIALYPKISFKYNHIRSLGDGYFLASNEQDKYARLITEQDRDCLPGARIVKGYNGEAQGSKEKNIRAISLLIEQTNDRQSWVYYTYNGILHCDSSCYNNPTTTAKKQKQLKR